MAHGRHGRHTGETFSRHKTNIPDEIEYVQRFTDLEGEAMRNQPPGGQTLPASVKLPLVLDDMRAILRQLNWEQIYDDVRRDSAARLAIVGPVNAGKSTLFNTL